MGIDLSATQGFAAIVGSTSDTVIPASQRIRRCNFSNC